MSRKMFPSVSDKPKYQTKLKSKVSLEVGEFNQTN